MTIARERTKKHENPGALTAGGHWQSNVEPERYPYRRMEYLNQLLDLRRHADSTPREMALRVFADEANKIGDPHIFNFGVLEMWLDLGEPWMWGLAKVQRSSETAIVYEGNAGRPNCVWRGGRYIPVEQAGPAEYVAMPEEVKAVLDSILGHVTVPAEPGDAKEPELEAPPNEDWFERAKRRVSQLPAAFMPPAEE
jgi:hypothetical protein